MHQIMKQTAATCTQCFIVSGSINLLRQWVEQPAG